MIKSKADYKRYLKQDALALRKVDRKRPRLYGDTIWKFQRCLRKCEYHNSLSKSMKLLHAPSVIYNRIKFERLSIKYGFCITFGVFDEGMAIAHRGTIVVSNHARIGKNCRIHEGVTIGGANGSMDAAKIGNNVFIGPGVKIVGDVTIADDVALAPNTVVTKSITEPGTTWGGVPAKMISAKNSHANLSPYLF
ncbi:MAG: serine acetyltransferase [Clostridia bacterium]|nr:serine acetyltransferase [Clostridia bacterium]